MELASSIVRTRTIPISDRYCLYDIHNYNNLTRQAKQAVKAEFQASMAAHNVDRQSNTHPSSDTFDGFSDVPAQETATLYDSSMDGIDGLKTRLKSASQTNKQVDGTEQK